MAVPCGACNTENRDAAKFCKGCGRKIAQAWPQAASPAMALASGGEAGVLQAGAGLNVGTTARAAAPVAAPAPVPPPVAPAAAPMPAPTPAPEESLFADIAAPRAKIGNGRWIATVLVGVALLVAAAGWWGHKNRSVPIAPTPITAAPAADAPAPDVAAAPVGVPADLPAAAVKVPAVTSEKIELAPAAPEPAKPAVKPRTAAAKKAPPPAIVVQEMPAPPPAPPAPAPVVVQAPQGQCGGRNIVAAAQCMAEQCGKPEFRSHAQCEAVRRQQRLEEEKRNPSLLN